MDYMAPEILSKFSYDKSVDIWGLGVFLFELLHGYPPFQGKSNQEKCINIVRNKMIQFSDRVSKEAQDLIQKILLIRPRQRYNMSQIFTHPWMRAFIKMNELDPVYENPIEEKQSSTSQREKSASRKQSAGSDSKKKKYLDIPFEGLFKKIIHFFLIRKIFKRTKRPFSLFIY